MGKSTISMAIFNSYVKLPEGIPSFAVSKIYTAFYLCYHFIGYYWLLHAIISQ